MRPPRAVGPDEQVGRIQVTLPLLDSRCQPSTLSFISHWFRNINCSLFPLPTPILPLCSLNNNPYIVAKSVEKVVVVGCKITSIMLRPGINYWTPTIVLYLLLDHAFDKLQDTTSQSISNLIVPDLPCITSNRVFPQYCSVCYYLHPKLTSRSALVYCFCLLLLN